MTGIDPEDTKTDDEDGFLNVSKSQALEEEERRRQFDVILKKPLSHWSGVDSGVELKEALSALLFGLRSSTPDSLGDGSQGKQAPDRSSRPLSAVSMSYQNFAAPEDDQQYEKRSEFIPLRISDEERSLLATMEAALDVSDYTDKVDILIFSNAKMREIIRTQIMDFLSIVSGLLISNNFAMGKKVLSSGNFADHAELFQKVFELARRHKISNPEKLRTEYGKMIYLLQDSQNRDMVKELKFSLMKPLETVRTFLEGRGCLELLGDPELEMATRDISTVSKNRENIAWELGQKARSRDAIVKRWVGKGSGIPALSESDIVRVLESIGDSNSFLRSVRDPCDEMIGYLKKYFKKDETPEKPHSLSIAYGRGGARLTHTHKQQYNYVLQSLLMWREVASDMYKLWYLAEKDLLSADHQYSLRSSLQGLCRIQSAPNVSKAMKEILSRVKTKTSSWVGSWVVHLGDHNVPNAFIFIDKYNQIGRILTPIVHTIRKLDEVGHDDDDLRAYIKDNYRDAEAAKR
mmetsp:Transcript_44866/g.174134  ORF Transcript_44866/g.174134 Transcript_44866/m.174134 type:complete len:519 (-) Transcript_44866:1254-2810(-)